MSLPIDRLVVATNVNDILVRTIATGIIRSARGGAHVLAVHGYPSGVEFRAPVVRHFTAAMLARCVALMVVARASRAGLPSRRARSPRIRAVFSADPGGRRTRLRATIRTILRETGRLIDPHRRGRTVAEKDTRDPVRPMVVLGTAPTRPNSDAVEAATGVRPPLPEWLAMTSVGVGARPHAAGRSNSGRAPRSLRQSRRTRRSRCMSVEVTRLSTGVSIVTDAMPHLETACWVFGLAAGSRDEQPGSSTVYRICSSTWPSRAPRGVRRVKSLRR